MSKFSISYETITIESAEDGDHADSGFILEDVTFREAMSELTWHRGAHVEANCWPVTKPRWFKFYNVKEDHQTGEVTHYTLHIPKEVTKSSRLRIAKLIGCDGVK
jgi:hypothetical protein